jgi:hypothetical protein
MKSYTKILALLLPIFMALPTQKAEAVPLGPFDVSIQLCQNLQFVSSIVNAWANATFPVTGTPGVVLMFIQQTSPLLDLCDFIIQLQQADTTEAIFLTADKLNNITEQKWDDYLRLTRTTYRLANSVYDFESGQKRAGTIDAVTLATDVGEFQRQVTELSTGNNPQAVKQRQENDQRISELANIAHERAILKEGTTCPEVAPNTPDYYKVVEQEFAPRQKIVQTTESDLNFIRYQLIDLGPRFTQGVPEVEKYYADVQNLFALGVTYNVSDKAQIKNTVKPTGKANKDGTAIRKAQPMTQATQVFTALINTQVFSEFRSKYEKSYSLWASSFWKLHSDTEGGMNLLNSVFRPLSFECNETRLMQGYEKLSTDEYAKKRVERFKLCESSNAPNEKKAAGLMGVYIAALKDSLYMNKKAQGELWGLESKYLGRKRSVSLDQTGNYFQEAVVCEKTPELIDLELIQAKQQEVNAGYNEIIARETLKDAMVRDEEIRRQKEIAEQNRQKRDQIERDNRSVKEIISVPVAPDLGGSR